MKTLFIIALFFVSILSAQAQNDIYICYNLSYENDAEYVSDEVSMEPLVYTYENDPVSKITFYQDKNILEVTMREMEGKNLLLTDSYGATLVTISLDANQSSYKFSLAAYDSDILYLITSGESGLFQYTIDRRANKKE